MNELISIIIPVYNHGNILPKTVDSIISQNYRPIEIIIVNDGSVDNFNETVKKIKIKISKTNNIILKIINQTNQGAPVARNHGYNESRGEFIIFWDADMIAKPTMLQKLKVALKENPDKSYAYSDFKFGWKKFKSFEFDQKKIKENNYIDIGALIKREDFVGFDKNLKRFQDWDLWLTMLAENKTGVYVSECLIKHLIDKKRISISYWLPKIFYKLPIKLNRVKEYEKAKQIIKQKHNL